MHLIVLVVRAPGRTSRCSPRGARRARADRRRWAPRGAPTLPSRRARARRRGRATGRSLELARRARSPRRSSGRGRGLRRAGAGRIDGRARAPGRVKSAAESGRTRDSSRRAVRPEGTGLSGVVDARVVHEEHAAQREVASEARQLGRRRGSAATSPLHTANGALGSSLPSARTLVGCKRAGALVRRMSSHDHRAAAVGRGARVTPPATRVRGSNAPQSPKPCAGRGSAHTSAPALATHSATSLVVRRARPHRSHRRAPNARLSPEARVVAARDEHRRDVALCAHVEGLRALEPDDQRARRSLHRRARAPRGAPASARRSCGARARGGARPAPALACVRRRGARSTP